MRKKYYKLYEFILCEVTSTFPGKYGTGYAVRRKGTEQKGVLSCARRLCIGDEVLCNVGDSDENGDNMVLCIQYNSDIYDRFKSTKVSAADLEALNENFDVRYKAFREEIEQIELERERRLNRGE